MGCKNCKNFSDQPEVEIKGLVLNYEKLTASKSLEHQFEDLASTCLNEGILNGQAEDETVVIKTRKNDIMKINKERIYEKAIKISQVFKEKPKASNQNFHFELGKFQRDLMRMIDKDY